MPSQFEAVAGSALGYSDDDTGSVTQRNGSYFE